MAAFVSSVVPSREKLLEGGPEEAESHFRAAHPTWESEMSAIDIQRAAPEEARIFEDGELVGEIFRDESAFEEEAPFYVVHLTEDPRGPKRIHARESVIDTVQWTVDSHPLC